MSKNDGASWEENDIGIANNYIRSICPSRFARERVYVAMTGINYDDLNGYLYLSEDYGKTWTGISKGLPNEPVNVILEDPTNENILYAGSLRGVYITIDRGKTWSYLGSGMPGAAVADLEVHQQTMHLVAATHGRGIYTISLRPIHALVNRDFPAEKDYLYQIPETKLPWFSSYAQVPDYRTMEKAPVTFWLNEAKPVRLSLKDETGSEIWATELAGEKDLNQYRWDLIVRRQTSDLPYFTQYEKYIKAGRYKMILRSGNSESVQSCVVKDRAYPYR